MRLRISILFILMLSLLISLTTMTGGYESAGDDARIIAITSTGTSPESPVSQNFGRCPYFIFFNCNDGTMTVVENPGAEQLSGTGQTAADIVINKRATHLVTGNIGYKIVDRLKNAGVQVITDIKRSMTVKEAIEMIRTGL